MHIFVVGPTSSIANHCIREWLRGPVDRVTLVGRQTTQFEAMLSDFKVRSQATEFQDLSVDFADPVSIRGAVQVASGHSAIDIALIAHGSLPPQLECESNLELAADTIWTNGVSATLFAEALASAMEDRGGRLAVISSVAGDRGRKSNYVYGSAKALVSTYVEGLQHRFADGPLHVSLIKPGPVLTPMTANLEPVPKGLADVEDVARDIVNQIEKGRRQVYTPRKWWLIMMVIRNLPFFIFKRLNI